MSDERYEDFLGPLPKFAPDPRQASFLGATGASETSQRTLVDERLGKVETSNVGRGWSASAPDLGFLQGAMEELVKLGKLDPESRKEVAQFLNWAVQRVIRSTISHDPGVTNVHFWTKDDLGVYGHAFMAKHESARGLESEPGASPEASTGG